MLALRRIVLVLVRVWVAMLLVGFLLRGLDLIGLEVARGVAIALLAVAAAAALWIGVDEAKQTPAWTADDIRDGAVGWGAIAALLLLIPCLLVPLPWSVAAAAAAILLVAGAVVLVRRSAAQLGGGRSPLEPRGDAAEDRPAL